MVKTMGFLARKLVIKVQKKVQKNPALSQKKGQEKFLLYRVELRKNQLITPKAFLVSKAPSLHRQLVGTINLLVL